MEFTKALIKGKLIKRYKRFFIDIKIDKEIIAKPFNELLKTIEETPDKTHEEEIHKEQIEKGNIKPKQPTQRDKEQERVNCPDCGKDLSHHVLKYDHTKFCKALQQQ